MEPAATVTGWTRALPARGTARLRVALRDGRDRLIASDPGLGRLRQGLRAVLAVGTTVLVEQLYAQALGVPPILALLMGAIVAMLASTSVSEPSRQATLLTMGGVPVAASVGAGLGVVTSAHHLLGLTTFVVVSFVAVWVRRFGPRWFTYGFLAWQGFFFALFLHPPLRALPYLVGAILVASVWVGLLLLTFLWGDPQVRLRRTVQALRARARAGISVMIEVLDEPEAVKPRQRLRGQMVQLSEIALLMDGQLADSRALPPGLRPGQVRRWAVDIEIAMDDAAGAVVELARLKQRHELPREVDADVRQLLHALGWGEGPRGHEWVAALNRAPGPSIPAVRRLAWAAAELLLLVERWESGDLEDPARPGQTDDPLDLAEVPFEPVVTLFGGNLPGSAMAASNIGGDTVGRSRWSPSRWALTTRQALQAAVAAALAIVAGESISAQRYYWAVIAAFIAFTGASNAGETVRRSIARVAGTMAGLVGAIGLAHLTAGHQVATVVGLFSCIFLAFYLQQISYAAMIFFITLMLGQMYTLLNTFTDAVLVLRLEETAAGAAIGVVVSFLVLPTGTRATARAARAGFLRQLADLLDGCAVRLRGDAVSGTDADLLALSVGLDAWGRQVVRTFRAVTRGGLVRVDRGRLRHRLSLLGACGTHGRALASLVWEGHLVSHELAAACADLAAQARRLAEVGALPASGELAASVADTRERVSSVVGEVAGSAGPETVSGRQRELASMAIGRLADALALVAAR
ncbi:FUSC family protein [Pedococcus sp.]|uniref:FUSC family protein n=1 Tax=Pedococcus sp. TaxID=2860345 RepID=UPI002E0F48CD|nr:FUSC family protein [Pedococcus sp.]